MPDPISTKLSVESDAWEAGFAAARKSLNRFGDDVNSTTAKIEAQIHTLKESFGRRSAFGELAEVFQGGGAIAGVGVAVEGLRRIYDAGQQIAEMVTHEQAKREEVVAATQRQNKELQGTVELMKRITSEREKVDQAVTASRQKQERFDNVAIVNPTERSIADVKVDYEAQLKSINDEYRKKTAGQNTPGSILNDAFQKINANDAQIAEEYAKNVRDHSGFTFNTRTFKLEPAYKSLNDVLHTKQVDFQNDTNAKAQQELQSYKDDHPEVVETKQQERDKAIAAITAAARASVQRQIEVSQGVRQYSAGSQATMLRGRGASEEDIKAAATFQQQVNDGAIRQDLAIQAIEEKLAATRAAASQELINGLNTQKVSQDAVAESMERGVQIGGEANKVLQDAIRYGEPVNQTLLDQAEAADEAARNIDRMAKAYSAVREAQSHDIIAENLTDKAKALNAGYDIEKRANEIQSLLSRGAPAEFVDKLQEMGAASDSAEQLAEHIKQLADAQSIDRVKDKMKRVEESIRSVTERADEMQKLLDRNVDPRFAGQLLGLGGAEMSDAQLRKTEQQLDQERKVNEVFDARKTLQQKMDELSAKQLGMTVQELQLRKDGFAAEADRLSLVDRMTSAFNAQQSAMNREVAGRNETAAGGEVRNHYNLIRTAEDSPLPGRLGLRLPSPNDLDLSRSLFRGHVDGTNDRLPGKDDGAIDQTTLGYIRDIRNQVLNNAAKVIRF